VCQASIIRLPGSPGPLLFSNAASTRREKLTVRLSRDDGVTWRVVHELHAGPAAYSCLAPLSEKSAACLYEAGQRTPYETIMLARFTLDPP
jgi:sialidase-1